MSDPIKFFRCKNGHTINDTDRLWGKHSFCPICEEPQLCGHPKSAIVSGDDGTCYCGECEKETR